MLLRVSYVHAKRCALRGKRSCDGQQLSRQVVLAKLATNPCLVLAPGSRELPLELMRLGKMDAVANS